MAIRIDPENNETRALFNMVNFSGQHVLEIRCGDGRVTWRYADKATRAIVQAGKLLDVEVLDYLVIGQSKWVSLKERSLGFV